MEELVNTLRATEKCGSEEFKEGRIILVDKPLGWSSFDVVNKMRNLLRSELGLAKLKVGHAGTLDPLASGLLIICTGRATKKIEQLMGADKEYVAKVTFGASTPSYDLETEPDKHFDTSGIDQDAIITALNGFEGEQMQAPPMFSAIKKDGKRLYEHARKGVSLEVEKRLVEFKELELINFSDLTATIRVVCSKGTYIRSFAHDLGVAMNSGAHLSGLIRTAIGNLRIENAISIEDFHKLITASKN
jgi:tRNA pseudouridine55 synthase